MRLTSQAGRGTCLLPGRFQPFHNGHAAALDHAASTHARVIIAISNAHISHTDRDPFTGGERFQMIDAHCRALSIHDRVVVLPVPVDDEPTTWVATIMAIAPPFDNVYTRSAWTESLFSFWKVPNASRLVQGHFISATDVRDRMSSGDRWTELVPPPVVEVIDEIDGVRRVQGLLQGRNHRVGASKAEPNKQGEGE